MGSELRTGRTRPHRNTLRSINSIHGANLSSDTTSSTLNRSTCGSKSSSTNARGRDLPRVESPPKFERQHENQTGNDSIHDSSRLLGRLERSRSATSARLKKTCRHPSQQHRLRSMTKSPLTVTTEESSRTESPTAGSNVPSANQNLSDTKDDLGVSGTNVPGFGRQINTETPQQADTDRNTLTRTQRKFHGAIVDVKGDMRKAIEAATHDALNQYNFHDDKLLKPLGTLGYTGQMQELAEVIRRDIYLENPDVR